MENTYHNLLYHVIFSVKERMKLITPDIENDLHSYIAGIAKANNFLVKEINGTRDHIHILLILKTDMPVSKAVQLIKGGSSKWLREKFKNLNIFAWQTGYGVFTVSQSQVDVLSKYIRNQKIHHRETGLQTEYEAFLQKNKVIYKREYLS